MRIAILGWGSLIWNPGGLPHAGGWRAGGPTLPIEFSRISPDGRLTLIVDREHGVPVVTHWTTSTRARLQPAIDDLAQRERCELSGIGWIDRVRGSDSTGLHARHAPVAERIERWCGDHDLDAAIWTALPATFLERFGREFSVEAGLDYVAGLRGELRRRAVEYIRRPPVATETPLRAAFRADARFSE